MYVPPPSSLKPVTATPFSVQALQVYPAASATTVRVMAVPTLAVPPDTVAELMTGVLASIVNVPAYETDVKAVFVLPASSESTTLIGVAPAPRSVLPSATVYEVV